MDRLERLLDLAHVLQTSAEPVPLSALRERFADYGGDNPESVRRKFERDKAELGRLGLVLRYVDGDEDRGDGYLLDTEASYLPEVALDEGERALLGAAARAALEDPGFPHRAALRLALAKLGAEEAPDASLVLAHRSRGGDAERVEALGDALTRRKRVTLRYRKPRGEPVEREVDPYGVFLRDGSWYLCGHDHRSGEVRVFRVARVEALEVNGARPRSPDFDVPEDFELRRYADFDPLRFEVHAPVVARVRLDEEVAFLGEKLWGEGEEGVFTVTTTHLAALVDQVLSFGLRAELLEPAEAREAVADALRRILAAHGEAP